MTFINDYMHRNMQCMNMLYYTKTYYTALHYTMPYHNTI